MKTAISVPDDVFEQAERAAKDLGVSRSELFTRALREFLGARRDEEVTASYNAAFADDVEEELTEFQRETTAQALLAVEWSDE